MIAPLTSVEFSRLMARFGPFESAPAVAVAASGGPDSLALALLAGQWAKDQGGNAIVLTVDHRLRETSTAEAHQVKAWLKERGIAHHILTWTRDAEKERLQTAIQAEARKARYHMLTQWCEAYGVKHLLTAHHAQDQLETFMMRLAKGSGLKGLRSMQEIAVARFGRILRPLLTVDARRLKAALEHFNQPFLADPSNENEDFTRIRWRRLLPALAAEGLTPQALQETLSRLNHAQRLVDEHAASLLRRHAALSPYGYATLKKEALEESSEALEEMLKRILATIGAQPYPVRRQALHRAMDRLKSGHSFTLGGCQIVHKLKERQIIREPAAIRKSIGVNQPGAYLWDGRFTVDVPAGVFCQGGSCKIAALGRKGIELLERDVKKRLKGIPRLVLQTLPALWREEGANDCLLEPMPAFQFTPHFSLFPPLPLLF